MERNKSYVPPLLSPERHAHHSGEGAGRGPRHAQLTGPYTPRDWGDVVPGDWFCADDETPNQIVFEYVDDELVIGRAQNIEAIDARCDYPLDFYLYIGAPTGLAIRRLMWKVMVDGVGLPDKGWNLERGVFRSRIVAGEDAIPFRDIEAGLLDQFGVRVGESDLPETERGIGEAGVATTHATTPRAKVIEGYFHTTQKLTSDLHGFAGFCEREEIPDHLKEFVARCKVGKEDPQGRRI